jgi:hypothetical protein
MIIKQEKILCGPGPHKWSLVTQREKREEREREERENGEKRREEREGKNLCV